MVGAMPGQARKPALYVVAIAEPILLGCLTARLNVS